MKIIPLLYAILTGNALADLTSYANFTRQIQQDSGIIWDMPTPSVDAAESPLPTSKCGSLFQSWNIGPSDAKEHLLHQKLVRSYLPKATVVIETLDSDAPFPRTRVDQPFSVRIEMSDLLTGIGLPDASTKVVLEQHVDSYHATENSPTEANSLLAAGYISTNGRTVLKFPASSVKAKDRTKASGKEHFIISTLSDSYAPRTEIASAYIQVWPVASATLHGITADAKLRGRLPSLQLDLHDLYPRSVTSLMLFQGTQINGVSGTVITSVSLDQEATDTRVLQVKDWTDQITEAGAYTLALVSETIYGKELLCDPITFTYEHSNCIDVRNE